MLNNLYNCSALIFEIKYLNKKIRIGFKKMFDISQMNKGGKFVKSMVYSDRTVQIPSQLLEV